MFFWRETSDGVDRAFTDRSAGHSSGPYAGLNLGGKVGDDPTAVECNRGDLAASIGVDRDHLIFMDQCQGAKVAVVEGPSAEGHVPCVDALVTATPGLALAALVADCTPILLWDNNTEVVAAVHAGRPGLIAGVLPAALSAMRDLGARQIRAAVGPSVCGRCYEVPEQMRADA
ncbi:MAG: polyphenol oxidase family protein, partial [Nostocoides sp.]